MKKYYLIIIFLICCVEIFAQQKNIVSGTIVDDKTGDPLPGATIKVKDDMQYATMADADGAFTLTVPNNPNIILHVTLIGYKEKNIQIKDQKVIQITLEEDLKTLDEVVVVGFTTQKKGSVIGAIDALKPSELQQPTRTLSTSLAGRVSGVIAVQKSGEPGRDGADFWIRGINTFTGNQKPLILIDGIERDLDNIDPSEIESFTVMKDATNTAIYGVRGGNGVILITTKKGLVGKPRISVRSEIGLSNPSNLTKFADGPTFMRMQNEALINEGRAPLYSQQQIERTASGYDPYYYPNVNWQDALIKDWSPTERVNVNVRGGSESVRYFIAASFLNQNGMFKKFDEGVSYNNNISTKRYNVRANVDANITKTTILGVGVAAILEDRNYPGESTGDILNRIRQTPPIWFPMTYADPSKMPGFEYGQARNPYQMLARSGYATENYNTMQSTFTLQQDLSFLTKGLQIKGTFSFDSFSQAIVKRVMRPRPYLISVWGLDTDGSPILTNADGEYKYVDQAPSSTNYYSYLNREGTNSTQTRSIYMDAQMFYNRDFGVHSVGGLLLYNQTDKQNMTVGNLYDAVPQRNQGLTGKVSYAYDQKYLGEFNFGYNGSENFIKNKRYGFFPAFALGWVPTKESFTKFMQPAIDYMKLRVSYGVVGNDNLSSRFVYLTRVEKDKSDGMGFGSNDGASPGSGKGTEITYYGNQAATWERAEKFDLGLELHFLKDFTLQVDYFHERRDHIWTQIVKTPDILGFGSGDQRPWGNVGEMKNRGVDGFLDYNKALTKDLAINFKGTFTYAKNEIVKSGQEKKQYAYQSEIGRPYGSNMGYVALGYFVDNADVDNNPDQTAIAGIKPQAGDLKYKDVNGDGVVDEFDRVYMGHPIVPEITYGIGAGISYKNFDFSFLFQGAANVSFFAIPELFKTENEYNIYDFYDGNYWTPETQDRNAKFPRLTIGEGVSNYQASSHWLKSGRYIRLKQAELGYTVDIKALKKIGISDLRFYTNGVNLFTITPFDWWDVESQNKQGDFYPVQRVINIGFELNF